MFVNYGFSLFGWELFFFFQKGQEVQPYYLELT